MAVLVTGGAGYIGSVATTQLVGAGEKVVILDNLTTGHRDAVHPEAVFVEGDTRDRAVLKTLFRDHDIDTVMHFAASSLVGESCENPLKYFDNNCYGAHVLLEAMIENGVKRFILSSTAAVYGDPPSVPITEEMPTQPLNPYGLSKRIIEQMLAWHDKAYGLRYVSLRYFNACGAGEHYGEDHHPETHLIPNVLMAADGEKDAVMVFGQDYRTPDGTCVRDYIHVEDLADVHLRAMAYLRRDQSSEIMNVGNSVGNSVLEVIESVRRVSGAEIKVKMGPRRPGDADRLVASSEKARRILGWTPKKEEIDVIVRDAWNWRKRHPQGYNA
jgi:UDP-glucose 4-epimerase